jgi:hypothetical protein
VTTATGAKPAGEAGVATVVASGDAAAQGRRGRVATRYLGSVDTSLSQRFRRRVRSSEEPYFAKS